MRKSSTEYSGRGFTLLELAIVLTLIGVIIGMGLVTLTSSLQASEYNATINKMDAIEKALLNYAIVNNRIPCPSDLTQTVSSSPSYYGMEAGAGSGSAIGIATGVCTGTGMLPQANFVAASGTVEGGVPTRALQLPDDYMYDGWGRKFRYAADPAWTKTSALPAMTYCSALGPNASAITVNDSTGAARTTAGMYALVSHGANGHGAYTSAGVTLNAGSVNADELTNCHCTSAGAYSGAYTPTYVEKVPMQDPSNGLDNFDDIVTFKEAWQMQAPNFLLSADSCKFIYISHNDGNVFVFDATTYNLLHTYNVGVVGSMAIDETGNIWMASLDGDASYQYNSSFVLQKSTYGSCDGGIALDLSGNVWVATGCDGLVEEFNPTTGAYIKGIGASGGLNSSGHNSSGIGSFTNGPSDVKIDTNGNLWAVDAGNNRIQEFNSGGTYVQQFGGGGGSACPATQNCVACTNTSTDAHCKSTAQCSAPCTSTVRCYCPGGSSPGTGQLNGPQGIAIDATGNIWVTDTGNQRVVEFGNTGTFIQEIGNSVFAGGAPDFLNFDSSGNLWVTDYWNVTVSEFNTAGTLLMQLIPSYNQNNAGIAFSSR